MNYTTQTWAKDVDGTYRTVVVYVNEKDEVTVHIDVLEQMLKDLGWTLSMVEKE